MNVDNLTIGELKEIRGWLDLTVPANQPNAISLRAPSPLIGEYVIVRCRDAGVHAGVLKMQQEREAVLTESRRLWYWKPANGAAFLSGVATEGLNEASKVGVPIRVHLTETCEIIHCTDKARQSIEGAKTYVP